MTLNRSAVPFALCLAVSACVSLVGASYFVGWPLNATELEFLIAPSILKNRAVFEGTTYLALAENMKTLSLMPWIVGVFDGAGVPPERLQVYLRAAQNLFVCAGVLGVFLALGGRRRAWLVLLALLLFIASGKHHLYYFKIVSSTFVTGLVVLAIAATLGRKMWLAAVVLALVGAVHPIYFLLTASAIVVAYWFSSGPALRVSWERLKPLIPLALAAAPILIVWAVNIGAIVQPAVDKDFWFAYMMLRSDLAFPLRQGYAHVLGLFVPLVIAGLAFWQERRSTSDERYGGLAALCAFCVLLVVMQIIGSELLRSATITRLAFSHRLQFSFDFLIYVAILWIALRRYWDSGVLSWLAVASFTLLHPAPLLPDFGLTDRGTLFLGVLAVQTIQDAARSSDHLRVFRVAGLWAFAIADLVLFSGAGAYLLWIVVGATVEVLVRRYSDVAVQGAAAIRWVAVAAAVIAAAGVASRPMPLRGAAQDIRAFSREAMPRLSGERWQGRSDYADFIAFVTNTVPADEAILAVPYYLGQSMTPVPYRAMYLDWGESNYVLYVGGQLDDAVKRLHTYGINPTEAPEGCTVWTMFFASPGAAESRCSRLSFQRQSWGRKREWRDNIPAIRRLSPKTQWVLISRTLLCPGEQPVAVWKDLALIRLNDAIAKSACVSPQA